MLRGSGPSFTPAEPHVAAQHRGPNAAGSHLSVCCRAACAHSAGPGLPPKGSVLLVIELKEVRGAGGDLEALPAQVGALPTLHLRLHSDFSAPLVSFSSGLEWHTGRILVLDLVTRGDSPPKRQIMHKVPALQTLSCFEHQRAKPFFLEQSCPKSLRLWVFLSVSAHLSPTTFREKL